MGIVNFHNMKPGHIIDIREIEISQLDLRYANSRIYRKETISSLVHSIESHGQIAPVITISEGPRFVLIDGYMRVFAIKRCGQDMVMAEIWSCEESKALIQTLARIRGRRWQAIEEAMLIREIRDRHGLSQSKIAHLMGCNQSWVARRLGIIDCLSDEILDLVRKGHISTWAAARVLAPMARAIPGHAHILAEQLAKNPISTRDLTEFYRHYQGSNHKKRERMIQNPGLFIKALHASQGKDQAEVLKGGPEGKCLKDLQIVRRILSGLRRQVPVVIYPGQDNLNRRVLLTAFEETRRGFMGLEQDIRRLHDLSGNETGNSDPAPKEWQDQRNFQGPQGFQEHSPSCTARTGQAEALDNLQVSHCSHQGGLPALQGECSPGPGGP
jgi:ParB/RepB/Spo0J family partition protein